MRAIRHALIGKGRHLLLILACLATLAVALFGLKSLAYSRASLTVVSVDQLKSSGDSLILDGLSWRPTDYVGARELDPIRTDVRRHCPDMSAYQTASCLMDLFARQFPHGSPRREFFAVKFDPVANWKEHLAGAPGHCVTRSGMLATALLALGFPARVVQIVSREGQQGHNVAEVWQASGGWRIFDPSFSGSLQAQDGLTSAVGLITAPYPRWQYDPGRAKVPGLNQTEALRAYAEDGLRGAAIVYPEPWLYTRVGRSQASFPFHGRFLMLGPRSWKVGFGQTASRTVIVVSLLWLLVALVRLAMIVAARRRGSVDVVEQRIAPGQELADFGLGVRRQLDES
jgi:hypothetical protein